MRGPDAAALAIVVAPFLPLGVTAHDIAEILGAIAWPVAVVAVVVMLRPALLDILRHLQRLRFRGLEAVFGEELAHVREIAEQAELVGVPLDQGLTDEQSEKFMRLAQISPRSAVIEAWGALEADARAIVQRLHPRRPLTSAVIAETLADTGVLDPEGAKAYYLLWSLRNQAAHEQQLPITTDEAIEYANLTRGLAHSLKAHGA